MQEPRVIQYVYGQKEGLLRVTLCAGTEITLRAELTNSSCGRRQVVRSALRILGLASATPTFTARMERMGPTAHPCSLGHEIISAAWSSREVASSSSNGGMTPCSSIALFNSKERAAFPQECDRRRKIPRAATCSMVDRPFENLCHRRLQNSFIAFDPFAYLPPR